MDKQLRQNKIKLYKILFQKLSKFVNLKEKKAKIT